MENLYELSYRANINVYHYNEKYIIIYEDHRTILNILFQAKKMGIFPQTPNLIFFDYHDDACENVQKSELLKKIGAKKLEDATDKQFWSFVEFDLGTMDDDWLLTGMELDLIKDAIVIGAEQDHNIGLFRGRPYISENKTEHELYNIPHLSSSLDGRGCLGDTILKEPYYQRVRNIMQYNTDNNRRFETNIYPFVLDFDLDCFSAEYKNIMMSWPEQIFSNEYGHGTKAFDFIYNLIDRASFITICKESGCCGGIGEANKILGYLDRYFFDGALSTEAIY